MSKTRSPKPRRASIRDVGREAGVSHTAVSMILNGKISGTPETRERVFEAARKLNYQPDPLFRKAVTERLKPEDGPKTFHKIIALIVRPAIYEKTRENDGYYSAAFAGACEAAAEANWNILLCPQDDTASGIPDILRDGPVDGVIIESHYAPDWIAYLTNRFPCAFLNRSYPGLNAISVTPNWERAGFKMVEHAWEMGHREFVFFQHSISDENNFHTRRGQEMALQVLGGRLSCPQLSEPWEMTPENNEQTIQRFIDAWLAATPRPTAILGTDSYCRMIIQGMTQRGIKVPDDVSFFGRSGGGAATSETPLLTTYSYPVHRIGYMATHLLLQALQEDNFQATHLMLDGELIIRDSARKITPSTP